MTDRRHHIAAAAALALLLCASSASAGTLVDLASVEAPSIHGASAEEQFGYCTAVGDLDGDGNLELVVGAPGATYTTAGLHSGAVFVFRVPDIYNLTGETPASDLAAAIISGSDSNGRFGSTVALADLDADGFDDLAVGSPATGDDDSIARGEVSIYFGGPAGSGAFSEDATPDVLLTGVSPGARFGSSLLAGDLDGDGAAELVVSEPGGGSTSAARPGAVYVLTGERLRSFAGVVGILEAASATVGGESTDDGLIGLAMADTDGDGAVELIIGACQADGEGSDGTDAGKLYVVPAGDVLGRPRTDLPAGVIATVSGVTERGFLGRSISAGDIDRDGFDELLFSAYASKAGGKKLEATGEVFVLFGSDDGPGAGRAGLALDDPSVPRFHGETRSDLFGLPVLLADIDGDGTGDIVAASQFADGPDNARNACGEIYIYRGSLRSVIAAKAGGTELADIIIAGEFPEDAIGGSLLQVNTPGSDPPALLVGAPDAQGTSEDGAPIPRRGKLIVLPGRLLLRS